MELILIVFIIFYSIVFLFLSFKIFVSKTYYNQKINVFAISLLIPVRNEEKNIETLIIRIKKLLYPNLEVIFVNDHSEDNTLFIIQNHIQYNVKIINLPDGRYGKKEAIKYGLSFCSGDWIILTDADTTFLNSWINSLSVHFENNDIVLAPVLNIIRKKYSFFESFEYLDTIAMQGISYATTKAGFPFLASGANIAVKKNIAADIYEKIDSSIVSGDDVFLLHEYLKSGSSKVAFCNNNDSIVYVNTQKNWINFFKQRLRWASKVKYYKLPTAIYFSLLIYLVHFLPFILLILSLCCIKIKINVLILYFLLKFIVDIIFIFSLRRIWTIPSFCVLYFPFVWLIYFAYISIVPIIAMFAKINWKNRNWK